MTEASRRSSNTDHHVENVSELSVCVSLIDAIRGNDQVKLNDILNKNITKFHLKPSTTGNFSPIDQRKDFFSPQFGNLLHLAASFGNRHTCQQFIANGISINATDKKGNTPLHRAAIAGRHDIVDYLLKEDNIDDTIRNGVGKTALDLCKTKECISTFEHNRKSYITSKTKEIFSAAKNADFPAVQEILSLNRNQQLLDINSLDAQSGDALIHFAVIQANVDALKWLLDHGANPFLKNKKGKLAVELAKDDKIKQVLKDAPMTNSRNIMWGSGSSFRMEGFLNKWTNYATGYKKRWFVLENGILSYYRSQADYPVSCRGSIHLKVAHIVADVNDRNRFEVEGKGSISYHVRADNKEDAKRWLVTLTEAKKWLEDMEPPGVNNQLLRNSPSDSSLENTIETNNSNQTEIVNNASVSAQIRSTLLQIDLSEQLLESLTGYLHGKSQDDEEMMKLFSEYSNCFGTIMGAIKSTLVMCEQREIDLSKRLVSENQRSNAMEETIQKLAVENNEFAQSLVSEENLRKPKSDDAVTDDEFYDAVSESGNLNGTPSSSSVSGSPKVSIIAKSLAGYPDKLRSVLPPRAKEANQVSLWSILKNSIGKDLTRMTIPVNFNEPLSMLQRMCEDMEYAQLLDIASKKENSLDRIQFIAAFAASNYASTDGRTGKPFNPLLGETFEFVSKEKGFRYVSEQVSHHPAISACYCESDNYIFWSEVNVKTNFTPTSFDVTPLGTCHVILKSTNEHFSWRKVNTSVHNIIMGKLWIDHKGVMTVTNHSKNNEVCTLTFKETGWRTKEPKIIEGSVKDASGNEYSQIKGKWNERLVSTKVSGQNTILWKRTPLPEGSEKNYNFTQFATQLNELSEDLRQNLCPTDCRLRPDQRAMEAGEYDQASKFKNALEEKQRAVRKSREKNKEEYSPRWFYRDIEEDTNESHWVFKGGYWESRDEKKWENVPSIFLEESSDPDNL